MNNRLIWTNDPSRVRYKSFMEMFRSNLEEIFGRNETEGVCPPTFSSAQAVSR